MNRMLLFTSLILLAFPCLAFQLAKAHPTASSMQIHSPTYSNRILFIRHAEKGWSQGQNISSVSDEGGWHKKYSHPDGHAPSGPEGRPRGRGRGGPPGRGGFPGRGGPPGRGGGGWPGQGGRRGPPNGLSEIGKQRAKFLPALFGEGSDYDIGKIFAAPRDADAKEEERTYATVAPLAKHLGLPIDITCANSELSCIVAAVEDFVKTSDKDILISWKHFDLNQIATALGAHNARSIYPEQRNDIIWIMQSGEIVEKRSMHCPGLDDDRVDKGDPDLRVEEPSEPGMWESLRDIVGSVSKEVTGVFGA